MDSPHEFTHYANFVYHSITYMASPLELTLPLRLVDTRGVKYQQVERRLGGCAKIAQVLGIKRKQTVHQWKVRGRIPSKWQLKLESVTGLKADLAARREAMEMVAYVNGSRG